MSLTLSCYSLPFLYLTPQMPLCHSLNYKSCAPPKLIVWLHFSYLLGSTQILATKKGLCLIKKASSTSQLWWHKPPVSSLGRQSQADHLELKNSEFRTVKTTQSNLSHKTKIKEKKPNSILHSQKNQLYIVSLLIF